MTDRPEILLLDATVSGYVDGFMTRFPDVSFIMSTSRDALRAAASGGRGQAALATKICPEKPPREVLLETRPFLRVHIGGAGVDHRVHRGRGRRRDPRLRDPARLGLPRRRGEVGQMMGVELLTEGARVNARDIDRFRFPAWSLLGGRLAAPFRGILSDGFADARYVGKVNEVVLRSGATITMLMPGVGGYGDKFAREPALMLADVVRGFISPETAARDNGLALGVGSVTPAPPE